MGYAARFKIGRRWIEKPPFEGKRVFVSGDLLVFTSTDDDGCFHLSISNPYRYPTWDEMVDAKKRFFSPDKEAVIVLPRDSDYISLHPNCFHIFESACQEEGRGGREAAERAGAKGK